MDYTIGRAKLDPWSQGLTTWFGPLPSSFSLGLMLVGILQLNFCIWEKKTHHPSWGLRRETASVCGGVLSQRSEWRGGIRYPKERCAQQEV